MLGPPKLAVIMEGAGWISCGVAAAGRRSPGPPFIITVGFVGAGTRNPTAIMSGAGWISRAGWPRPAASFAGAWPGGGLALLLVALAVQQGDQAADLLHVLVGPVE